MPTVKRLKRGFRASSMFTAPQREFLRCGHYVLNHRKVEQFTDLEHARLAWRTWGPDLLEEQGQCGTRPWGFYRFNLKMEEPPEYWRDQLAILEKRRLMSAAEQLRVEQLHPILGNQDPNYSDRQVRELLTPITSPGGRYIVTRLLGDYQFAAEWHERRGRPALAQKYRTLASRVQDALDGKTTGPVPTPLPAVN